jgi:hypothetical protein
MKNSENKREFSKALLVQESILIWIITTAFIILAFVCVLRGYLGSLPWLTSLISFPWSAYGVSQAFYYNKAKAENLSGGIKYETTFANLNDNDDNEPTI